MMHRAVVPAEASGTYRTSGLAIVTWGSGEDRADDSRSGISAALKSADDNSALRQVDVIPAQIASLGDPHTVAVDD